jgi:4-amino-4-deoxy-L-arabinose transferase-like glycosyltransferase
MRGRLKLQEWIHGLELGAGAAYVRGLLALVAFAMVALLYDSFCFRNFTNPEAMDTAQLGRNIGEGKGYTTLYVRPLSLALTREHRADQSALLKEGHPDISNPPVYPLLLAPLLRLTPAPGDLAAVRGFTVYEPNMFIVVLNQALFWWGALLVFRLTLQWFDRSAAWVAAILFVLTDLYWRFTMSGLSTILVMDWVLLLVWLLSRLERDSRENVGAGRQFSLALAVGAVTGLAALTCYSMAWLIVPVLVFVGRVVVGRRLALVITVAAAFALLVTPWMVRNMALSGLPFGTATLAALEGTEVFPADTLERSLAPSFASEPGDAGGMFWQVIYKAVPNLREILVNSLPRMGGNWMWAFFLAGLLVRFQNVNLSRVRWFVVGALALMIPVQAVVQTHLSTGSPEVNSENLLVCFSPLVLIFGVGLFFVLLESWQLPTPLLRVAAIGGFVALISLPLLLAVLPPRPRPFAAPYYPPRIQQVSRYLTTTELLMTDIPWAAAWYGQRQAVGLTLDWKEGFARIHSAQKPINGLFISTRTTDAKFWSDWFTGENRGWGKFLLQSFVQQEIPDGFPLRESPDGLLVNGELLLMDRARWLGDRK